jgi:UDP-glucose 4-epimerase
MNENTKILVTGGAGFIGSHMIDFLLKNKKNIVFCVDDLSNGSKSNIRHHFDNPHFTFFNFDVNNTEKFQKIFQKNKIERVYHFAANSDINLGSERIETDLKKTFLTTFNLLSSMKDNGTKEIIFASSSAIYGEIDGLLSEDKGPLFPISLYGAAKLASEGYISAFCENFGMKAWIVRFPNVVGWRLTHGVIYDFLGKIEKDRSELKILGDGTQAKPYLFIDDLIKAINCIQERTDEKVNCFNVAANSTTTVDRIVEIVINKTDCKGINISYSGGDRGWIGDVPKFNYETSKINDLGWEPTMSSDEAVNLSVEKEIQYRKNQKQ